MRKKYFLMIFSFLIILFSFSSCNSIFGPGDVGWEEKYVTVEVVYQRVDDYPGCGLRSPCHGGPVYLEGFRLGMRERKMTQVGCNLFKKIVEKVQVNYPREKYNLPLYKINVIDNGFSSLFLHCGIRAHIIFLNGKEITKIRKEFSGEDFKEYILVAFDENGVPHEF